MSDIVLGAPLGWRQIAAIAEADATLTLSPAARARLSQAHLIVQAIIERGIPAYGVNTGVGALSNTTIPRARQADLSRNILMSHAAGVGAPLGVAETRAIMAASVNNFAHGYSGIRPAVVELIVALLNAGCTPVVPARGSVGYLSHRAHIGLVLIGEGAAVLNGAVLPGRAALSALGLAPAVLEAKEGLCLVNGTPCAAGLAALAAARAEQLLGWGDAVAAMSFEVLGGQIGAFGATAMAPRAAPGLSRVAQTLRHLLDGSAILAGAAGARTQDALSLRAIPQVHGAVHDVWASVAATVNQELAGATDNPLVTGTPQAPAVHSQAHAVGAAIGLAMDHLGVALAQFGALAERRLDRLVNPLVSGLPAFLAADAGVASGFMIAQYTAVSLAAENRRLAAPASLDGGITSGLQEDMLCHATPAALKLLDILENARTIVAIEYLAASQAYDLLADEAAPAPHLRPLYDRLRHDIPAYADHRVLADDIAAAARLMEIYPVSDVLGLRRDQTAA
jgi:histidine ammonia-lyase